MIGLLAALVLHVGLRLLAWHNTVVMMNDGVHFLWQAERLGAGDWRAAVSHPYHPLYAATTALFGTVVTDLEWAGVLASLTASAVLTVAAWGLARHAFPETRGAPTCAALVAAINARTLQFGSDVQAEMLMCALLACGLWALLAMARRHGCGRRAALAGLCTGLAYLTRFEGLFLCLPFSLWMLGAADVPWRTRLRSAALFGGGVLLCAAPYVLALHEVSGRWGLSLKPSLQRVGVAEATPVQLAPEGSPLTWPLVNRDHDWDALEKRWKPGTPGAERAAARRRARDDEGPDVDATRGGDDTGRARPGTRRSDDGRVPPALIHEARAGRRVAALGRVPEWLGGAPAGPLPLPVADPSAVPIAPGGVPRLLASDAPGPGVALNRSAYQLLHTLRGEFLLPALIGLVMLWKRRRRLALVAVACVAAWWLAGAVQIHRSFFLTNRHMLIPLVVLLPLAGAGFAALWSRHVATRVLAVLIVYESTRAGIAPQRGQVLPRLAALEWVQEHTDPDEHFLTQRQRDGWYADRVPVTSRFPVDEGALRDRIRRFGVRYMVLERAKVERYHPDWFANDWVHEVQRFGEGEDLVVVLEPRFP